MTPAGSDSAVSSVPTSEIYIHSDCETGCEIGGGTEAGPEDDNNLWILGDDLQAEFFFLQVGRTCSRQTMGKLIISLLASFVAKMKAQ